VARLIAARNLLPARMFMGENLSITGFLEAECASKSQQHTDKAKNTVPAPYLTPNVAEALDRMAGKKLYCSFDFSSGFHQFWLLG
jgi:hypothetical protein